MSLLEFAGRLHPLVLHFPIALIVLAGGIEVVRLRFSHPFLVPLVPFLLGVGAAGAVIASATGWIFAYESYPRPSLRWALEWHRWLGIGTAFVAACAAWLSWRLASAANGRRCWLRRVVIWAAVVAVSVTGHLGAMMVWDEDYFGAGE